MPILSYLRTLTTPDPHAVSVGLSVVRKGWGTFSYSGRPSASQRPAQPATAALPPGPSVTPPRELVTATALRFARVAGILISWADDRHRDVLALGHHDPRVVRAAIREFVQRTDPAAHIPDGELLRAWVADDDHDPTPVTICRARSAALPGGGRS